MNKKMIIGLVIVAGVLLVSVVVLLVFAQRATPIGTTASNTSNATAIATTNTASTTTGTDTPDATNTTPSTTVTNTSVAVDSKTSLYQIAKFFTERYGSYSTDNEHENIDSLRPFMTDAMQTTADALITTQANTASNEAAYYGVTTQSANVKIIDYAPTATGATVEVVTRRVETTAGNTKQYTQTARLQLKTINDAWKVDTFKWQKL